MAEGAGSEGGHLLVQAPTDPGHLRGRDARGRPQGGHQVVDLAGGDPVHVGLHDHGEQGPVDAPAPLQDRGEEAALAQLGDLQVDVAGLGGEQALPGAVAPGAALLGALVAGGTDALGRLGLDQRLEHQLHALADHIDVSAGANRVQQVGKVGVGQGHRGPPRLSLVVQPKIPGGPPRVVDPRFYTTSGHVNAISGPAVSVVTQRCVPGFQPCRVGITEHRLGCSVRVDGFPSRAVPQPGTRPVRRRPRGSRSSSPETVAVRSGGRRGSLLR